MTPAAEKAPARGFGPEKNGPVRRRTASARFLFGIARIGRSGGRLVGREDFGFPLGVFQLGQLPLPLFFLFLQTPELFGSFFALECSVTSSHQTSSFRISALIIQRKGPAFKRIPRRAVPEEGCPSDRGQAASTASRAVSVIIRP